MKKLLRPAGLPVLLAALACLAALALTRPGPAQKPAAGDPGRWQGGAPQAETANPDASPWNDAAYVRWLEERSMLHQAARQAEKISGRGVQWRHPYAEPRPDELVRRASVWVLDYPGSVVTKPGRSVIATWADRGLWDAWREIGIDLLHTGPVKQAGGIVRQEHTPTTDGWFDRISLKIDPQLGTEEEYRQLVQVAADNNSLVAGDLVPLHTGTGADFRLAQRAYKEYPGMYVMVEVGEDDWGLLPEVDGPWGTALVPKEAAVRLMEKGYIPGLINSNDAAKEARAWSGWSATGKIVGVDGKARRWVYLHFFKPTQPVLNWLDPSLAGPRAVYGDLVRTVHTLGAKVVRLDAVPFLGVEPKPGYAQTWHFMHPLSLSGTNELAWMARKLGGWTFQELNVPLPTVKKFMEWGPDLSYDFFTRAQVLHSLLTEDAVTLRLAYKFLQDAGVPPGALIHDLQNHDEITYQLVQLDARGDETFEVHGEKVLGRQLREKMLRRMRAQVAGEAAPYNKLYRPEKDGVATTFAGFIAAGLGVRDPHHATPGEVDLIRRGHLLVTWANAMQPGVFSLSSWDMVGALPVPVGSVEELVGDGDYRWINRGGVDLMGANPDAAESAFGLPRAQSLYGPLPEQLKDPKSYAAQLKRLLDGRKKYRLAEAELLVVPEVENTQVCLLVMQPPGPHPLAVTALNFGRSAVTEKLDLKGAVGKVADRLQGRKLIDAVTGEGAGVVPESGGLNIRLEPLSGKTLVVLAKEP